MVRLKSRTNCPVNGFWFRQPETGFNQQTWDFNSLVTAVQQMRQANPRFSLTTDVNTIADEIDQQNALRMLTIPRADSYIVADGGPAPNRAASRNLAGLAGGINNAKAGAGALKDWLGAGGQPVAGPIAEARGGICATCPQNEKGDWTSWFTLPAANLIRAQLGIRNDLRLETTHDAALNVCAACGCPLKLKVHAPLEHIAAHTGPDVKAKLDPRCWILSELKVQN